MQFSEDEALIKCDIDMTSQAIMIQNEVKFLQKHRLYLNLMGGFFFVAAILLYNNLFDICPYNTDSKCIQEWLKPQILKLIIVSISSSGLFVLVVFMALRNLISKLYIGLFVCFLMKVIFIEDHVMSTTNYQIVYQFFEILFILIFGIISIILVNFIKCWIRWRMKCLLIVGMIILVILIYFKIQINNSCVDWKKGLNGQSIDQSGKYCQIVEPSVCWYDIFDGFMDASKIYDCTSQSKDINPQWIEQYKSYVQIPEGTKYIEMPRTEYFEEKYRFCPYKDFQQYVLSKMQFLKDLNELSQQAESYLDLEQMKYVTKIKRNESLIESRSKSYTNIQNQMNRKLPKSIITIFVDAVSRTRFIKKLKKSSKWFAQQEHEFQDTHQMFQAFRYMAVGTHTTPNFYGYEYGVQYQFKKSTKNTFWSTTGAYQNESIIEEQSQSKYKSITQMLQEAGYITAKSRTICGNSITEHELVEADIMQPQPIDHEFVSGICDPNYMRPNNQFGIFKGPYSVVKKCLYGKEINQYVFDYGRDFLQTYHDVPKYLELYFLDGHEGTGDAINHFDDPLFNFLNWLIENNHHKQSYIMMVSDHGLHMQGPYYLMKAEIYHIEVALPGLFVLIDKDLIEERERKAFKENQQKVVTSFEIHYTLQFFTSDNPLILDKSLFSSVISEDRDCTDIPLKKGEFCACVKQK
ncbi:unnamed protein product [Paramecium sonneborni]|uniref:Uncharacterized protein n=1 Tax=Paramecium sonneborni TaxID=65129 RepID=A0A8S1PTN0_9CILI|nr:unnamed protein product [Paramecium sonneborni]